MKKIIVGITGASGSIYAKRMIEELLRQHIETHVVTTKTAEAVFDYEIGQSFRSFIQSCKAQYGELLVLEENENLFAGIASGSYPCEGMVILPCSMGTLAELAGGLSKNLLTRAADVALKENRKLIVVPRETPLHAIHLENMLALSRVGATILPAMPGFYHGPQHMMDLVDFVIGKILDQLKIENTLFKKWE